MRKFSNTWMVGALAAALLIGSIGCNSSGGGAASSYDSPQAVFDAAKAAMQKKDYETFCECLTPESQTVMAGGMAVAGNMMKMFAGLAAGLGAAAGGEDAEGQAKMAEMNKQLAKIDDVMKKHGVDEAALSGVNPMTMGNEPDKAKSAMIAIGEKIKDKPAFLGDMLGILDSLNEDKSKNDSPIQGTLENVKTDGDKATGEIVNTVDGAELRKPIAFQKIDGSWRIDLPMEAMN